MVEQSFPNSHTTTTAAPSNAKPGLHLDLAPLKSKSGMLKCAEILFNILGFICILSSRDRYSSRAHWFATVSMGGFWFSGIILVLYIFHVPDKLNMIPWVKIEFVFCTAWTLFYLIAASLAAGNGFDEAFAAAATLTLNLCHLYPDHFLHKPNPKFFGFVAMVLYGCDAFLKFVELKNGRASTATVGTTSP